MPLHEYVCRTCDRPFEALVTARSADPVRCPACGGEDLERLAGLPSAGKSAGPATNCRGDGPPCGAVGCGRRARMG
jgi:putative FmdB family regulatory protein